jgi:hypothetical protein
MSRPVATRPELEAARLLLDRMGITPADLLGVQPSRPTAPTFAEYVPVVAAAVSEGSEHPPRHRRHPAGGDQRRGGEHRR